MSAFVILERAEVQDATWQALSRLRHFNHTGSSCAGRPAVTAGQELRSGCEPCGDLYVDALLHVAVKVRAPQDTPAYVYTVVANWSKDWVAKRNARADGVAKPERRDGAVGRIRVAIATGPESRWRDRLLTLLLTEASRRGRVSAEGWPYSDLVQAKSRFCGRSVTVEGLRRDVESVLSVVVDTVGHRWLADNVQAPIQRRNAEFGALNLDDPDQAVDIPDSGLARKTDPLAPRFWRALRTAPDPVEAMRSALGPAADGPAATRAVRALTVEYLADLARIQVEHRGRHAVTPSAVRAAVRSLAGPQAARRLTDPLVTAVVIATQPTPAKGS
ncbi:hypothetical protein [Pseudonocardia oroxyli]|uniref:Uncharacterized protein n=1 Tax=Pseudonocardia oroxyli TaxID=366584 RepID=A0A1G8CT06_PSEOR|nr:hypothetical protein [Pseudonocardia oroxyli]SDH48403.1 hypothetical protein SAMN05216377_12343 [Pseudonocardia oroxyli]